MPCIVIYIKIYSWKTIFR